MTQKIVELLAPAGNLEKLKVTVSYGCDAVYLGGEKFGLRSAADNFTNSELEEGVSFAHERGVKVYVVLNSFLYDKDLEELPPFLAFLEQLQVDAVIVSDLGVLKTVKELTNIPIHLSTQASCLNIEAGKLWKKMGAKRLILGREVSILEAAKIKRETGLEVELFIHGSLCMAFSGNCVISNYTMGRDSNRGGCAHNCRFEYSMDFGDKKVNSFFMSSKDLMGISQIPEFFLNEIDSIKVEGRMKTHLYVGT
ncbi:MAG: U32 family peptidase, partial [Epsilonproteobacteria bacterium]